MKRANAEVYDKLGKVRKEVIRESNTLREVLLRCDHFDTPGGVGLRNLTRIDYRKLRDIGHRRE